MKAIVILTVGILALAGGAAIWFGFVPRPGASTLIHIRNGALRVKRGQLRGHSREHVAEILRDSKVATGFIAITHENRVRFSRQIPAALHQRLRNVLLNP